jgi:hypothetical protein
LLIYSWQNLSLFYNHSFIFSIFWFWHIFPKRSKLVKLTLDKWKFPSQHLVEKKTTFVQIKTLSRIKGAFIIYKVEDQSKGVKIMFVVYIYISFLSFPM